MNPFDHQGQYARAAGPAPTGGVDAAIAAGRRRRRRAAAVLGSGGAALGAALVLAAVAVAAPGGSPDARVQVAAPTGSPSDAARPTSIAATAAATAPGVQPATSRPTTAAPPPASPPSRRSAPATPVASAAPAGYQDQTITASVRGPATGAVGVAITVTATVTWSAEAPRTEWCAVPASGQPSACPDVAGESEVQGGAPYAAPAPGSRTETHVVTFDRPGTYRVGVDASTLRAADHWRGEAGAATTIVVTGPSDPGATPTPTS